MDAHLTWVELKSDRFFHVYASNSCISLARKGFRKIHGNRTEGSSLLREKNVKVNVKQIERRIKQEISVFQSMRVYNRGLL